MAGESELKAEVLDANDSRPQPKDDQKWVYHINNGGCIKIGGFYSEMNQELAVNHVRKML